MKTEILYLLITLIVAFFVVNKIQSRKSNKYKRRNQYQSYNDEIPNTTTKQDKTVINYKNYKAKWIFTLNEKDAYWAIKEVTDELGLILLAKVRLFDLVEPKKGTHIVYQHKIQAKHVDFVVCDSKLIAKVIIELDDSSHDRSDRKERDAFVDEVLWNTGYTIIRAKGINKAQLKELLQKYSTKHITTE